MSTGDDPQAKKYSGRFSSGAAHPRWVAKNDRLAKLKAMDLGPLKVVGADIVMGARSRQYVETKCSACGEQRLLLVDNIVGGKTTNCRCQRGLKNFSTPGRYSDPRAVVLGERFDAIIQRCRNPEHEYWPQYGGRGIKLHFSNRDHFIGWMLENLPHHDYRDVQIDRIDNDGHYAPGNLRLVPQAVNMRNRQASRKIEYRGAMVNASDLWHLLKTDNPNFSLSQARVAKLVGLGRSLDHILSRQPRMRNGRISGAEQQPDPNVVALYRGGPLDPTHKP